MGQILVSVKVTNEIEKKRKLQQQQQQQPYAYIDAYKDCHHDNVKKIIIKKIAAIQDSTSTRSSLSHSLRLHLLLTRLPEALLKNSRNQAITKPNFHWISPRLIHKALYYCFYVVLLGEILRLNLLVCI